jgi:hypothetical protein
MSESTKRERGDYRLPDMYDNGYKVIPPKMYRSLCRFRGTLGERQIYDTIYWETVGWGYEWWRISLSYFASGTGILHKYIPGYIRSLLARKMIRRRVEYGEDKRGRVQKLNSYAINPNWDEWLVVPKKGLPQAEDRKPGSPKKVRSGSPKKVRSGSPQKGTEEIQFLNTTKKYMSGMTPGRASLSDSLKRKHPPDDNEKTEFSRIFADFCKEHPHRDLDPTQGDFLYGDFVKAYPDVNLISVLGKKFEAWRKKVPRCFRQRPKNSKMTQEQNPRDLLDTALSKEQQRIKESGK